MRCEACAARLRGNLAAVEGVDGCTVQLAAGVVEVW
jgi:copper chaperone CopZ